jgi:competence protein ComEC
VGSFALCLYYLSGIVRLPGIWRILPAIAGTWAYVWLTGSSPSAVRSGIMITCLSLARFFLRQPQLFPAIVLSAWLVLVLDPLQVFSLGFQLSYSVVASIILCGLPLGRYLRNLFEDRTSFPLSPNPWNRRLRKFCTGTIDLCCVSFSAGIVSMPLIIQSFGLFTPGGVFFGIILNPLASLCVMLGCLSMLTGLSGVTLAGSFFAALAWPVIRCMEWLLGICLQIPGAFSSRAWEWHHSGIVLVLTTLGLAWFLQWIRQSGRELPVLAYFLPFLLVLAGLSQTSIST